MRRRPPRSAASSTSSARSPTRYGRRLGWTAGGSCRASCGIAAAFLAMNRGLRSAASAVTPPRRPIPARGRRAHRRPARVSSVFDVQLHFVRDDFTWNGILELGEWAKRWNPVLQRRRRHDAPATSSRTSEGGLPRQRHLARPGERRACRRSREHDPDEQHRLAHARALVNAIAGTRRHAVATAILRPGQPGWLDQIDRAAELLRPDSWKGYTVGDPLAPSKWPWRMDDETRRLPWLRAHGAQRHPHRLRPQGPRARPTTRRTFPNWELRAGSTTWARPHATGRSSRS